MCARFVLLLAFGSSLLLSESSAGLDCASECLEIHYINVGQGGCTLIVGPNGTRILYDFGKVDGARHIVPYLREAASILPEDGLHIAIVSHRDSDHYMGYKAVVEAGYKVLVANYDSGSPKQVQGTLKSHWFEPATKTAAGAPRSIPVGLRISLGNGAEAIVMAANGRVHGGATLDVRNENDRSIALFIHYGNFQYMLDGDLGGGRERCTGHRTAQKDVQTFVAQELLEMGLINEEFGVDVLHIAHHGSESSTPARYYNVMRPEVGLISVGVNQGNFFHPRVRVVERVLLDHGRRPDCVAAPPLAALFQTEDGARDSSGRNATSFLGLSVGDIVLRTDGVSRYELRGSGRVNPESSVAPRELRQIERPLDETLPDAPR